MEKEQQTRITEYKNIGVFLAFAVAFAVAMFIWGMRFGLGGDLGAHATAALEMDGPDGLQSYNSKISYPLWHYVFRIFYAAENLFSLGGGVQLP